MSPSLDKPYLDAALRRAGKAPPSEADAFSIEPLLEGRTGAEVAKLRCGESTYVVKTIPCVTWRAAGMECPDGGEPRLWLSGIASKLPASIRWPVIDVTQTGSSYRVLMEDVGTKIRGRGQFTIADSRELVRALGRMHAACFESDWLARAPLPTVAGTVRVLAKPLLHRAGAQLSTEPWVADMLADFGVLRDFVPGFLEVLEPRLADGYLALLADEAWQTQLTKLPATLLHGDLRRANIAFEDDRIALIDWELAATGPGACDVQWHVFLHYWAYPPDGVRPGEEHGLRDLYLQTFGEALGRRVDRAAFEREWALAWIKATAQLAYVLYDPLYPNGGTPERRAEVKALATRAVQLALDARESTRT